jgi:hypothetical protein
MPGMRKHRPYSEKQKMATVNSFKRRQHTDEVRNTHFKGSLTTGIPGGLNARLDEYLVDYDARLIEIDHKYPFGNPERPEWLIAHRKNGIKRIGELLLARDGDIATVPRL